MSKLKHDKKAAAPQPAKSLSAVKDGRVGKSSQTPKAKSKDLAKQVAAKREEQEKKTKKVIKQPTPEPESDSEDDENDESGSDISDSEESNSDASVSESDDESVDEEAAVRADAPKINGAAKADVAMNGDSESDASEDDEEEEKEAVPAIAGAERGAADDESATDESSEDDEEDSDEDAEIEVAKVDVPKTSGATKAQADDDDEDEDDSEDDEEEDSDESEDDEEDEEEEAKPEPPSKKRKAEPEPETFTKKAKSEFEGTGRETNNLFVGNLSWNVDEDMLSKEFDGFGEIAQVRLITDRNTGRSKGFGYVEFIEVQSAVDAYEVKNGAMLDGRQMNVDYSKPRPEGNSSGGFNQRDKADQRANRYGDKQSAPSETIFVGNLSFDATADDVREAFEQFGDITRISIPTDRDTGSIKGFGYVSFGSIEESTAALNGLRGVSIQGRPMRLDFATPRDGNDSSPRGGFSGRGRGDFGGRGGGRGGNRGGFGGRGGSRGGRGGGFQSTNRGGFGDFKGKRYASRDVLGPSYRSANKRAGKPSTKRP